MNKTLIVFILFLQIWSATVSGQTTSLSPGEYKHIQLTYYNYAQDYTENLILLHEMYDGALLGPNYAVGTLTALRGSQGSWNRMNIAEINTASSYDANSADITSTFNNTGAWKLKSCLFNGKKYLALEVPYNASMFDSYRFAGWTNSTAQNMQIVAFKLNGQTVNRDVLSNIQDFVPSNQKVLDVPNLSITGNVAIGTTTFHSEKLSVNGKIRAHEVKVETANWPDYVFYQGYQLPSLAQTEAYIQKYKHLPEIPSAQSIEANGVELGEMNKLLLKKVEELTLHLIEKDKKFRVLETKTENIEKALFEIKKMLVNRCQSNN